MSFQSINPENDQRPEETRNILLFGFHDESKKQIEAFLDQLGESKRLFVDDTIINNTVENLIEGNFHKHESIKNSNLSVEFMLVSGFSQKDLTNLLNSFKELNLKRPIIATSTKLNRSWYFNDLVHNVYDEHLEMTGQKNKSKA